eukprot:c24668_g1_i1 orf=103-822(+)
MEKASNSLLVRLLLLSCIMLQAMVRLTGAADPDPLQDYCVADVGNSSNVFINGFPCKNPALVTSADFQSSVFRSEGAAVPVPALGLSISLATAASFPGLNTQGLSMSKIEFASKGGFVPPHVHPRASELILVVQGVFLAGFVDAKGTHFSSTLYPGDLFLFPRGLVHYQIALANSTTTPLAYSSYNSQNPGISLVASALFESTPPIPTTLLQNTFPTLTQAQALAIRLALVGIPFLPSS